MVPSINLLENFSNQREPDLIWRNTPKKWSIDKGILTLYPDAKTDYWQRTHYGFQNDNGHFLHFEMNGDFVLTTRTHFFPQHQYDQAGLMVRISPHFWIKTSIEYEPHEPNRLGVVVTRYGYSDWSTQDISKSIQSYQLRIRHQANDYIVDYRPSGSESWSQIRMAHLENIDDATIQCGVYACSPIDSGFKAAFDYLRVDIPD
jgi:regulation of enolase protein 1 (concanavalin A-like superfamily)